MQTVRLRLAALALLIGVGAVALGLWWTAAGMAFVILGQVLAWRKARRGSATGLTRSGAPPP